MRVLSIRAGSVPQDIASGRHILLTTIRHPSKTVMIIRGAGSEITRFADKAASRSDPFPWRDVVWATDERLILPEEEHAWFDDHANACAVILNLRDLPAAWLDPSAQLFDIDMAFLEAEGR
jgi:hypothetical protein